MSENRPKVVVVGGGISGLALTLAIRDRWQGDDPLAGPEPELLLLESEASPGGKIRTDQADGFTCEWGVNGFLNKEPRTLELVQRLGLQERLLPATAAYKHRYLYTRGKLRALQMHPLKFFFSGILPWGAKWRLIRELWVPKRDPAEGDESVAEFASRRIGPVAYRTLVDPMQTGIYAGDPERMSVFSAFPRVTEVEQQYGSLIKGMAALAKERRQQGEPLPGAGPAGHLTSFRGGMQALIDALARELSPSLRTGAAVRSLRPPSAPGERWQVLGEGLGGPIEADAVVLACPAHAAAGITAEVDGELSAELAQIPYSPIAVLCLGFHREQVAHPLDGFGFLAPRDAGLRMLGALWTSTIFPERAPEGQVLLRVMVGGARDGEALDLSDEELLALVQQELGRTVGAEGEPAFVRIFRHPLGIPQYLVGHGERLERLDARLERLPGLLLGGNAYRGIAVNDCAKNAHEVADQVLATLGRK